MISLKMIYANISGRADPNHAGPGKQKHKVKPKILPRNKLRFAILGILIISVSLPPIRIIILPVVVRKGRLSRLSFLWTTNLGLFDRQLNLRQPILRVFLVPDAVDIALSGIARDRIAVILRILVDEGISLSELFIRPLMHDA